MKYQALDPRLNRIDLPMEETKAHEEGENMHWHTYEIFCQQNRGDQHIHVGNVHASDSEMAFILAKEQFARREQLANIWVVKTADVYVSSYEDQDMFNHAFDKSYREGDGYKVRITIDTFVKDLDRLLDTNPLEAMGDQSNVSIEEDENWKIYSLADLGDGERKILVKK